MDIYINNKKYSANDGDTVIQVADRHDIHIPRFCYHKRLSIVASCRMCLVDIEGAKYPQPACSTIVNDGMRINTSGPVTENAQKSTMEFLLINHPLDCPICDQAGECELQDVSLEHGDYKSSYSEIKRTVIDKDIGSLVSTEMTRCIHCSRCVRFGEEVAGIKELGMTGRGEDMKIETFVNQSLTSQLSGNVIDLCPVGALNNNLYKYSARTWDLKQTASVSSNDCLGSNIFYHTYKNDIKRCVPKENEEINLSWLSDQDRFGYEGFKSDDRVLNPLVRRNDVLVESDFKTIADSFMSSLVNDPSNAVGIMSAQSTCEEMYLFQKLLRFHGISKIDHRTKECDFRYQSNYPALPSFDIKLSDIENMENIIIVGTNISDEFPILSIYLRDACKKNNTNIYSISTYEFEENFNTKKSEVMNSREIQDYFSKIDNASLSTINDNSKNLIIIGPSISFLSNYSEILNNVSKFAESISAKLALLGDQANSSGAWAMGIIPHRLPGGISIKEKSNKNYNLITDHDELIIIYNLEPEYDFSDDNKIIERLKKSKTNIFFSSYLTESINKYADVVFPLATQPESSGSFINTNKQLQSFNNVVKPYGNSRTGTSILLELLDSIDQGMDYDSVCKEIKRILSDVKIKSNYVFSSEPQIDNDKKNLEKIVIRNPNSSNPTLRRSESLLKTHDDNHFLSIPSNKSTSKNEKITFSENNNKFKLNIPHKVHNKPNDTLLVKIGGKHEQKIGAYSTNVEL